MDQNSSLLTQKEKKPDQVTPNVTTRGYRQRLYRDRKHGFRILFVILSLSLFAICMDFFLDDNYLFLVGFGLFGFALSLLWFTRSFWTWQTMKLCPRCGCPYWKGHIYCGDCDRLLKDTFYFFEPGKLDLSKISWSEDDDEFPIARMISMVILLAIKEKASDIIFEPGLEECKLGYRVRGKYFDMSTPPLHLHRPIIQFLKGLARLDLDVDNQAQQGKVQVHLEGHTLDCQVVIEPSETGERMSFRLPDQEADDFILSETCSIP
jgi:hypothetical protein